MRLGRQRLGGDFGDLTLGYVDWGDPASTKTVLCVHGLTRNARDFDALAAALADTGARVLAVDVVGRGRSDRLVDPALYRTDVYAFHLLAFLKALGIGTVDWVGTSMGGIIGMIVAAMETPPIRRLVLNDVGAFLPAAALAEIRAYLGLDVHFPDMTALERYLRTIHGTFGPLDEATWRHLAEHSARPDGDGFKLAYDPAIKLAFEDQPVADVDLWPLFDKLTVPTLVLRGGESRLLLAETAAQMAARGPRPRIRVFDGVGHAPALVAVDQIAAVRDFLAG